MPVGTEPRRRWPSLLCDACTYSTFWVLFFLFSACWSRHSLPHSSLRSVRGFSIPVGRFLLLSFTGWGSRGVGRGAPSFVVDSARPLPLMLLRRRSHSRRHRPPPPASPAAHLAYRRAVTSQSRRSRGATRTAGGGGGRPCAAAGLARPSFCGGAHPLVSDHGGRSATAAARACTPVAALPPPYPPCP